MRRGIRTAGLAVVVAAALVLTLAATGAAHMRITTTPAVGRPSTHFVVRFRNPRPTGTIAGRRRYDVLSAVGPNRRGCASRITITLRPAPGWRRVTVILNPRRFGRVWCAGRFHGQVVEVQTFFCRSAGVCAGPAIIPRTLARFSFRVRHG